MIFACLHWSGSLPSSNDVRSRVKTRCLTTGQVSFQTAAGRPSSPGAFHDLAANSCLSTSSIVIARIAIGGTHDRNPFRQGLPLPEILESKSSHTLTTLLPGSLRGSSIHKRESPKHFPKIKPFSGSLTTPLCINNSHRSLLFVSSTHPHETNPYM
ncbi:hypothetical protein F5883DRAFT_153310 [Diaporthe sp. PMI_573]|nr:hypothetical protein F5883DRAFT_153310 [Diaporthaceae sp. PMI_573]